MRGGGKMPASALSQSTSRCATSRADVPSFTCDLLDGKPSRVVRAPIRVVAGFAP